jgi:tetratricopeptide (TPR) repeat protein
MGLMPAHKAVPLSRNALRRGMELSDPSELPEMYAPLAGWAALYDYDWKEAERLFRIARTQESPTAIVRYMYASCFLLSMGLAQDAVLELERALEEDPLNIWWRIVFATAILAAGKPVEAARELYRVLELDPNCHQAYYYLAGIQASRGLYIKAYSCARKAWALAPLAPLNIALRAASLKSMGRGGAARKLLAGLASEDACQVPMARSVYHLICSEMDEAADWAEKAIAQREPTIVGFLRSPVAKDLRASPRWAAIARMTNLQP